jgi:hypothetical protein
MNEELELELKKKYPKTLALLNSEGREPICMFGIECGDGWYKIIDEACAKLEALEDEEVVAAQIKEKFGSMRFYVNGGSDEAFAIVREAEDASERTCETCGEPGQGRGTGWYYTACDACEEKIQSKRKLREASLARQGSNS